jgi:hypothetical protein
MPNYIRACFCVKEAVSDTKLQDLLRVLSNHQCYPINTPQSLAESGVVNLTWRISNKILETRILHIWHKTTSQGMCSFDIEDSSFLQGGSINYNPGKDELFTVYKILLIDIIRQIDPVIGVIDYEADLLCSESDNSALASWGNYFSAGWLNQWDSEAKKRLLQITDEFISIDTIGSLTFIHPLAANQAWTRRHKELEELIKRYSN